jgi:hypothetical protein
LIAGWCGTGAFRDFRCAVKLYRNASAVAFLAHSTLGLLQLRLYQSLTKAQYGLWLALDLESSCFNHCGIGTRRLRLISGIAVKAYRNASAWQRSS